MTVYAADTYFIVNNARGISISEPVRLYEGRFFRKLEGGKTRIMQGAWRKPFFFTGTHWRLFLKETRSRTLTQNTNYAWVRNSVSCSSIDLYPIGTKRSYFGFTLM